MTSTRDPIEIVRAAGSRVHTADGRELTDLANGFGAVFLGHCHPRVAAGVHTQLAQVWSTTRHPTRAVGEAHELLRTLLPAGLRPAGFYSTGMETAEFAMRAAAAHTGRSEFVGFARSMHGKSAMTAALCWNNALIPCDRAHLLPFPTPADELAVIRQLADALRGRRIAAVFIEPIQGSNGARAASDAFCAAVLALCREHGSLCIFDEILTGLYRTGASFHVQRLELVPDVLLLGKCLANGLPFSAIAVRDDLAIAPAALSGSTFSDHPVSAAAAVATLTVMRELPMAAMVASIDALVREMLVPCGEFGATLRGRGALWALELAPGARVDEALQRIVDGGVLVTAHGRCVRLLPAATIDAGDLRPALATVARACAAASL